MEQSILHSLSRTEAQKRKNSFINDREEYNIRYTLILYLTRKSATAHQTEKSIKFHSDYSGKILIDFTYNKADTSLFLDYNGKVKSLKVNSIDKQINHNNNKIYINNEDLVAKNKVIIEFESNYMDNGMGINYSFQDNLEYIYTCLEPFECNSLFPCFDQPDLKAVFQLALIADCNWTVVSNTSLCFTKNLDEYFEMSSESSLLNNEFNDVVSNNSCKELKICLFEETQLIPTYVFGFCAGDYFCYDSPFSYQVNIKLYCTHKVKNCTEAISTSFKVLASGIDFMENYLSTPYPFKKCDLIFIPEFPAVAMENVGMPIFTEEILKNYSDHSNGSTRLINLILHELSHMWFGNLITPSWWDDLWLNESFASFFAYLIILDNEAFKYFSYEEDSVWNDLHFYKSKAYFSEHSSKCHPLIGHINDTDKAAESFDVITYNKGCGILKQLYYLLGKDSFCKAIREYFTVNQWKNTNYSVLLEVMNKYTERSSKFVELKNFMHSWLSKSGLNTIELEWEENEEGFIIKFRIHQTCSDSNNSYQTHLIDIMGLDEDECCLYEDILIQDNKVTSIDCFFGKKAMKAYLPNFNDWSYVLVQYDSKTIDFMENHDFKFKKEYQKNTYLTNIRLVSITKKKKYN
jgi:aminopeptidase N